MPTKTFSGDQGLTTEYKASADGNGPYDVFDLSALTGGNAFHVYLKPDKSASSQDYPCRVDQASGGFAEIFGPPLSSDGHGQFVTNMGPSSAHGSQTGRIARKEFYGPNATYNGGSSFNSAQLFVSGIKAHIHHLAFGSPLNANRCVDAIRLHPNVHGSVVEYVIIWQCGDDALECDNNPYNITIRDCLWMNLFAGISATHNVGGKTITCERLTMHHTLQYEDDLGDGGHHMSPWKTHQPGPQWVMNDCVIAVEKPNYEGYLLSNNNNHTEQALANMTGSGNTFCFLDASKPSDFPQFPAGWTVLENVEARNFWDTHKTNELARLTGGTVVNPTDPYSVHAVSQDASTGIITILTDRAFTANPKLTLSANNSAGSDTATLGVTIG